MTGSAQYPFLPRSLMACASLVLLLAGCNASTVDCPPAADMVQTDAAGSSLQQQLQQQQLDMEKLRAELNESAHQLQQAQQQLAEKSQQLDTLTQDKQAGQISAQNTAVTVLEQQLAAQQQEIEHLQAELNNKPQ